MTDSGGLRHGFAIGRVEFRRTVRALRSDRGRLALIGLGGGFMSLLFVGLGFILSGVLRSLEGPVALPAAAFTTVTMLWTFGTFLVAQRTVSQRPRADAESLLLTTTSSTAVAAGLAVAEFLRVVAYVLVPVLVVTGVFVYAFGSVVSLLVVPLAVCLLLVTLVLAGQASGYTALLLVARYRFVAKYKTVLGTAVAVAFFGAYFAVQSTDIVSPEVLSWVPVGWVVDLAVLGTPVASDSTHVIGSMLTLLAVGGAAAVAVARLTAELWFTDGVSVADDRERPDRDPTAGDGSPELLAAALTPFGLPELGLDLPTKRVAEKTLLRVRRNPSRVMFVLIPVLMLGSALINLRNQPAGRAMLPVLVALALSWLAGAAFGLNPLGDEGSVLPATLTTPICGGQFVRGLLVPGVVFGVPVALAATAVAAVVSPYSLPEAAGVVALCAFLLCLALPLAVAVGFRFPRLRAIEVRGSKQVVPPSLIAVVIYSTVVVGLGVVGALSYLTPDTAQVVLRVVAFELPALAFAWLSGKGLPTQNVADTLRTVGQSVVAVAPETVRVVGSSLVVALTLGGAVLAYRYAVRRFETHELT